MAERRTRRAAPLDDHNEGSGTYDELVKANGFFADLVARQQIDSPDNE